MIHGLRLGLQGAGLGLHGLLTLGIGLHTYVTVLRSTSSLQFGKPAMEDWGLAALFLDIEETTEEIQNPDTCGKSRRLIAHTHAVVLCLLLFYADMIAGRSWNEWFDDHDPHHHFKRIRNSHKLLWHRLVA